MSENAQKQPGLVQNSLNKGLELFLNQLILLDETAGQGFAPLDEKVIQLTLTDIHQTCFIIYQIQTPEQPGQFSVQSHLMGAPDTHLKMTLTDLINLTIEQTLPKTLDPLGQTFLTALQQLDVDWEEQLSKYIGDFMAFKVGNAVRHGQTVLQQTKQTGQQTLKEYLQFEINLLPTKSQVAHFNQAVQTTAQQVDQLEQRLQTLSERLSLDTE